jgi:pimeloyl-ACP methyl ester carboxylesterase
MFMISLRRALLFCAVLLVAGCNHMLAERMVAPPNAGLVWQSAPGEVPTPWPEYERAFRIPVSSPDATLLVSLAEPDQGVKLRGTVMVLHGIGTSHDFVIITAKKLTAAGYRTIGVDLRGHGGSTGKHISYGVFESHDLSQVLDYLQKQHLVGDKIGVYGCSYGAATAIQFAACDPRVVSVVAAASFSSLRDEAPEIGRRVFPLPGAFLSDQDYTDIVTEGGKIAGFDPDQASPVKAIARTSARVLLIHGQWDGITPLEQARKILAAAPPNTTELRVIPNQGHVTVSTGVVPEVLQMTVDWFHANLPPELPATGPVTPPETSRHS